MENGGNQQAENRRGGSPPKRGNVKVQIAKVVAKSVKSLVTEAALCRGRDKVTPLPEGQNSD